MKKSTIKSRKNNFHQGRFDFGAEQFALKGDWEKVNQYINRFWPKLLYSAAKQPKTLSDDDSVILYLPHPYIVPGGRFEEMFYWDSFFIIEGLAVSGLEKVKGIEMKKLIKGMVENCFYQIEKYGYVLNGNKIRYSSRSQPPFLTSMIEHLIKLEGKMDKNWLARAYDFVKQEYSFWTSPPHLTPTGLSRYFDLTGDPARTRSEDGWDMSPRFSDENVHHLNPVDLNALLYKYENDLAMMAEMVGKKTEAKEWLKKASDRKKKMTQLMWSAKDGLFYDYNFIKKQRSNVKSLAAIVPLWVKMATSQQAEKVSASLKLFWQPYGLSTCDKTYGTKGEQWNYPVGWAPLHFLAYKALIKYGYAAEAKKVATAFLNLVTNNFNRTGQIWEKYNVVSGGTDVPYDRYRNQPGFGWTNAIFQKLFQDLKKIN